jgi:hypothetical protein
LNRIIRAGNLGPRKHGQRVMLKRVVPFAICSVLALAATAKPQDWHHYVAVGGSCQRTEGRDAGADGTIGATFIQDSSCYPMEVIVTSVQANGPAAQAGIQVGDTLFRVENHGDDMYTIPLSACDLESEIRKSTGRPISLFRLPRNTSNAFAVTLNVRSRSEVYPEESARPSSISETVEIGKRGPAETKETKTVDGKTITFQECPPPKRVSVSVTQVSQRPETPIHVDITISNSTGGLLPLSEGKFFLLDANHRQVQLVTYEERKFQIESLLYEAQKQLHRLNDFSQSATFSLPMPTPPAPPVRYSIDAVTDGSYTISPMGMNAANVSGTSTSTLTLNREFDSSRSLAYLANTITYWVERRREEKWNKEMQAKWEEVRRGAEDNARESNRILENWKRVGFSFTRPLAPNEIRSGFVLFSPLADNDLSSLSLILVLTDADTQKDQFTIFRFHR